MNINQFTGRDGGSNIPPMEGGTFTAVCSGVVDLGTHTTEWNGEVKQRNQLLLMFDFPTETIEIQGKEMPRCLSIKLTKSQHENSKFRQHIISWRGRDFTQDELDDFHMSKLLGVPATVSVIRKEVNGKKYANISTIAKAIKGIDVKPTRKIYFDMSVSETYGAIEELPDWVICLINQSAEAIAHKWIFSKKASVIETANAVSATPEDDTPF